MQDRWLQAATLSVAMSVAIMILGVGLTDVSAAEGPEAPTFAEDVAPILYDNCVTCHRAGEIAPMSLITYAETRPWSRSIKNQVTTGEMPPWHADPAVGKFANARGLTEAEKDTLVRWADSGAPEGDRTKLPPVPTFSDGWQFGTPDVVIEMPESFEVPAEGEVAYQYFSSPTNFTNDTWVRAIEVRAGARSVVHHVLVYVKDPDGPEPKRAFKEVPVDERYKALVERRRARAEERASREDAPERRDDGPGTLIGTMAPGSNPMVFESDTALRIPKGSNLVFQIHYTTTGTATADRSVVGMIFADQPPAREMRADAFLNPAFEIPAGASDSQVDTMIEFTEDAEIFAILPHTHLRGKRWDYRLTYPDGRNEQVLAVPNYDFDWQTYYVFDEPIVVPKGAQLMASAWYDNSEANKANPDPTAPVRWGEQTWEEMQYTGIYYTVPVGTPSVEQRSVAHDAMIGRVETVLRQ